jgi:hypothetical protein
MTKVLLTLGAAAAALTAVPVEAKHHAHHHGRHAGYHVGYVFGPRYGYTAYRALPAHYVTRYRLTPHYRYVHSGNAIYVVDPASWAVVRVLNTY